MGNPPIQSSDLGKMPPQNIEIEKAVLGACLLDREAIINIADVVQPESFYVDAHSHIFQAIVNLFSRGEPTDSLTVSQELSEMGKLDLVGGRFAIMMLTNNIASSTNIVFHATIIQEKFIARKVGALTGRISSMTYDDKCDIFETVELLEKELLALMENKFKSAEAKYGQLYRDNIKALEEAKASGKPPGIYSGFNSLDAVTGGFKPGQFILIAGRPGMGKTAFMLSLSFNLGLLKIPGVIFSLEMTALELIQRLTSIQTEIPLQFMTMQTVEGKMHDKLMEGVPLANNMPIYIDDPSNLSVFELRAKARRYKMKYGIQYLIVDYLQLMDGIGGNREQEISNISRTLKSIAKELKIPVIALSQLSRTVESRDKSKKPQLSDLRESGSLEQDADMVLFPFRPEYYQITNDAEGQPLPEGYAEINIAKHRNGATGEVEIRFRKNLSRYENILAQYTSAPIENYYEKHEKPDLDNPF